MPTARPSSFLDTFLSLLTPRHPTGSAMGRQRSLLTLNRPEQAFIAGRRLLSARTDTVLCISLAPSVLAERKQHPQLHVVLMADLVWGSPRRSLPFQSHPKACQFFERHPVHRIGSRERSVQFSCGFLGTPIGCRSASSCHCGQRREILAWDCCHAF